MPESLDRIAEQLIAAMTPEARRGMLRAVIGGSDFWFTESDRAIADIFEARRPEFGPAPTTVRGFRIRLSLSGTKPPVWRRLAVPGDLTLDKLHTVIQAAMGWMDSHLHSFRADSDPRAPAFLTRYDIDEDGEDGVDETTPPSTR